MLRYIQPEGDEVSLDFLTKSTEASDYLHDLKLAKLSPATILNYIKNMIRFVQYAKTFLHVAAKDPDFHRKCQTYIDYLCVLRKSVAKENSRAICQTRYKYYVGGQKSIKECQKVLTVAKKETLNTMELLNRFISPSEDAVTHLRYYCEAIMILGHFQRPGAVEGMTVSIFPLKTRLSQNLAAEWLDRKNSDGRVCIGVSRHKTATMQIATFALTGEEEEAVSSLTG
ncbi:uncharacterized protein LOC125011408 [Mugil cephalus]|uniref:uncharacterized protein LOC125011408 n=1 Tax=Mugil cephalus TaxID=48193 RepID=UPI001FB62D3F|nr:uncharacterized protein LOC125011408 [Mugil cephalus]